MNAGPFSCALASIFFAVTGVYGEQLSEARVTHVVEKVTLYPPQAAPRQAMAGDVVDYGTSVRTGPKSRCELTFTNQTVARLGADTTIGFNQASRSIELGEGAMLFAIPKGGQTRIRIGAINAASKGATGIVERHGRFYIKFLLLEGEARLSVDARVGESVLLHPGQILITKPEAVTLPDAAYFDIARVMKTCLLVREFRPLLSTGLIELEEQKQARLTSKGSYIPSNLVIFGRGTLVSLVQPPPGDGGRKSAAAPEPTH
jgi:FecR-like protein